MCLIAPEMSCRSFTLDLSCLVILFRYMYQFWIDDIFSFDAWTPQSLSNVEACCQHSEGRRLVGFIIVIVDFGDWRMKACNPTCRFLAWRKFDNVLSKMHHRAKYGEASQGKWWTLSKVWREDELYLPTQLLRTPFWFESVQFWFLSMAAETSQFKYWMNWHLWSWVNRYKNGFIGRYIPFQNVNMEQDEERIRHQIEDDCSTNKCMRVFTDCYYLNREHNKFVVTMLKCYHVVNIDSS